jgi:hypothetical protein
MRINYFDCYVPLTHLAPQKGDIPLALRKRLPPVHAIAARIDSLLGLPLSSLSDCTSGLSSSDCLQRRDRTAKNKETVWMALKEENHVEQQDVASFFFGCCGGRSGGYGPGLEQDQCRCGKDGGQTGSFQVFENTVKGRL